MAPRESDPSAKARSSTLLLWQEAVPLPPSSSQIPHRLPMQKAQRQVPLGPARRARFIYDDLLRYLLAGLPLAGRRAQKALLVSSRERVNNDPTRTA